MSIEAMKQALEALEKLFGIPEQFTGKGAGDVAVWTLGGSYRAQQAIPVLRQAIAEAEKQEPFGYFKYALHFDAWVQNRDSNKGVAFYTHPPKREWVGLEDKDVATVKNDFNRGALWAEQVLKEKNT